MKSLFRKLSSRVSIRLTAAVVLACATSGIAFAMLQEEPIEGWPREIPLDRGSVVVYQPQSDTFEGNNLSGRAAVSVTPTGQEPVFGTVWFEARLDTNRDTRMAAIDNLEVTRVGFPAADEAHQDSLARLLEREIPAWELDISMDRLLTDLELAETRRKAAEGLNMEPPVILFSLEPAILVTIDGEPRMQQIEGSEHMRVLNTPFTIIFVRDSRTYYLGAGEDQWYSAPEYTGPWALTDQVPEDVGALAPEPLPEEELPQDEIPEGAEPEEEQEP